MLFVNPKKQTEKAILAYLGAVSALHKNGAPLPPMVCAFERPGDKPEVLAMEEVPEGVTPLEIFGRLGATLAEAGGSRRFSIAVAGIHFGTGELGSSRPHSFLVAAEFRKKHRVSFVYHGDFDPEIGFRPVEGGMLDTAVALFSD